MYVPEDFHGTATTATKRGKCDASRRRPRKKATTTTTIFETDEVSFNIAFYDNILQKHQYHQKNTDFKSGAF